MSFSETIDADRGLGSAYERYYFYELLDRWHRELGAKTFLEGPLDGMAGVPGVHGVGLARRGASVISVVRTEAQAAITRAVYRRAAPSGNVEVRVLPNLDDMESLPEADLVLAYHALEFVPDWRAFIERVAKRAQKGFVITTCNPDNWGVEIIRSVGKLRGIQGLEPPDRWRTDALAPTLWRLGRVREHEFFDCPWWPDLQVSPGQSLADRAKKLVLSRRKAVTFTADAAQAPELARRFVYGADRWPYFGDDGFDDELGPALKRHPSFDRLATSRWKALAGHLHAFLVDVSPRTPQQRRRLRLADSANEES